MRKRQLEYEVERLKKDIALLTNYVFKRHSYELFVLSALYHDGAIGKELYDARFEDIKRDFLNVVLGPQGG